MDVRQLSFKGALRGITIVLFMVANVLQACNSLGEGKAKVNPIADTSRGGGQGSKVNYHQLYSLRLMKAQVDALMTTSIGGAPAKKLVLQFWVHPDSVSPQLIAYPAKNMNKFSHKADSQVLWIQSPVLDVQGPFFMGDNQVLLKEGSPNETIEGLIKRSAPSGNYQYLLFTPKLDEANHVKYLITVVPQANLQAESLDTQPSPPADVN